MELPPGIPDAAQPTFRALLGDSDIDHATLASLLTAHVADINARAATDSAPTLGQALAVANQCRQLLEEAQRQNDAGVRRLVWAAVHYFIRNEDGDHDLASPHGLDDDAAVCNAVALAIGRKDLLISS